MQAPASRDSASTNDFAAPLEPWFHALTDVRPDLFDRIAREFALAKGIRSPPDLRIAEHLRKGGAVFRVGDPRRDSIVTITRRRIHIESEQTPERRIRDKFD